MARTRASRLSTLLKGCGSAIAYRRNAQLFRKACRPPTKITRPDLADNVEQLFAQYNFHFKRETPILHREGTHCCADYESDFATLTLEVGQK